ncbi:hypothetical protein [Pseudomonas cremoricolorata]|uniref:Uncharacterized protein n=1 Tax=Pseudomonas cremoricolorata TaxID=157783 RepID=A0A089Y7L3_9PSED|nr:hypothetical protein [Pseudomonas cremoricolorata]AIR87838.1 hypothetical protein LK03_00690 [Pseudomonas cremoricolorata]
MNKSDSISPLSIIAIFAGIIEASALASLPFLSRESQYIYTWFLVAFPFFLTVLFFLTLNFNYRSLWRPSTWLMARNDTPERSEPRRSADTAQMQIMTMALSGPQTKQEIDNRVLQALGKPLDQEQTWLFYDLDQRLRISLTITPGADPPS